jgi:hypothetical protein
MSRWPRRAGSEPDDPAGGLAADESDEPDTEVVTLDDAALLAEADWVIGGEEAQKARRQALYVAYVVVLLSAFYGFPFVQAVFRTTDQQTLRDQLTSPVALVVLVAAVAGMLLAALWVGRFRGPVVPPLPWIDLVVTAPVDRARSVRRWWRYALAGSVFVGVLTGTVLGGGLAFAGATSPVAVAVGAGAGLLVGVLVAHLWLHAQVRSYPSPNLRLALVWRVPDSLRELHVESLRAHSANTSTLSGSAMTGNLRTARLALARPVRFARATRLRPGRPFPTLVRRDALGMLRAPSSFGAGLGLAALGAAVTVWGLTTPAAPGIAVTIGIVPLYLGFGAWSEGLRLQADNVGTPSLIGTGPRTEAAAHLVVPAALTALVLAAATALSALSRTPAPAALLCLVALVPLLAGGHLLAAFRGTAAPTVQSKPQALLFWYLTPALVVLLLASLLAFIEKSDLDNLLVAVFWLVYGTVAWGLHRVRRLTHEHRG